MWKICILNSLGHSEQFVCKTKMAERQRNFLKFPFWLPLISRCAAPFSVLDCNMLQSGCSEIKCTIPRCVSNRKQSLRTRRQSFVARTRIPIFPSYFWLGKKSHIGRHKTRWWQMNQRSWRKYQLEKCLCKQAIGLGEFVCFKSISSCDWNSEFTIESSLSRIN